MNEAVQEELDALRAIYEDGCSIAQGLAVSVTYVGEPRCDSGLQAYVTARMTAVLGSSYPASMPDLTLADCRGDWQTVFCLHCSCQEVPQTQ